jgi:outer membrane protein, heavy metal efflux system
MDNPTTIKPRLQHSGMIFLIIVLNVYSEPEGNKEFHTSGIIGTYIKRALDRNPQLVARRSMVLADSTKIGTVALLPDPTLSVAGIPAMSAKIGKYAATQMIPWPGRFKADRNAARYEYFASGQLYKDLETDVLFKVRVAYGKLYTLIRMAALQKESVELLKRQEEVALADYATSMQTQSAVLKLQLEIAVIEDQVRQTNVEADMARDELAALLDTTSGAFPDPDTLPDLTVPKTLDEAQNIAMNLNPEVKAAEFEVKAAQSKVMSGRAMFYPDLMVSAEYTTQAGTEMTGGSKGWMLMTGISLPIWFRPKIAEVKMAKHMEQYRKSAFAAEKTELAAEARQFYRDYNDALRRIDLLDSVLLPKAKQTLTAIEEAYRNGRATIMEYIDSERMLLDLQMQLLAQEERRERMAAEIVICCLATY